MLPGELLRLEDTLWVLVAPTGEPIYDFPFDRLFASRRTAPPPGTRVVSRIGAVQDYAALHGELSALGLGLVHDPEEHRLAVELPSWYPRIADLTPRSRWFDSPPDAAEVEREFGWPVFLKGHRQTSSHRRQTSIVEGPDAFRAAMAEFATDPILGWQRLVCREFVRLRPVEDPDPLRIPSSFEFRTVWWRGRLAGFGRYWWQGRSYDATPPSARRRSRSPPRRPTGSRPRSSRSTWRRTSRADGSSSR